MIKKLIIITLLLLLAGCGATVKNEYTITGDNNTITCEQVVSPVTDKKFDVPVDLSYGGL